MYAYALIGRWPGPIEDTGVIRTTSDFSARRNCDAQTWTYLLPTYVFQEPPPQTHYYNPVREDEDAVYTPVEQDRGVFRSLSRRLSQSGRVAAQYNNGYQNQSTTSIYDTIDKKTPAFSLSAPVSPVAIDDEYRPKVPPKGQDRGLMATFKRMTTRRGRSRSNERLTSPVTPNGVARIHTPYANGVLGGQAAE